MPLVRLQLSLHLAPQACQQLMAEISAATADTLGKPESYMMVVVEPDSQILMGASADPSALLEVRSVGTITPAQATALSQALSTIVGATGVPKRRIYSNFAGVPGAMWGMGESTFG